MECVNTSRVGVSSGAHQIYYLVLQIMNQKVGRYSLFSIPSYGQMPEINQSLKMINTVNALPHSEDNLLPVQLQPQHEQEEDSLGDRISAVQTVTNTSKKKKVGCTCKKTFCLKMYCECYSSGRQCAEECACSNCRNLPEFLEELAVVKQVPREGGLRNCSLSEKRCNCKKSRCLKRYCECYNSGVGCSEACKCEGCENKQGGPRESSSQKGEVLKEEMVEVVRPSFPSINEYKSLEDFQKFYT